MLTITRSSMSVKAFCICMFCMRKSCQKTKYFYDCSYTTLNFFGDKKLLSKHRAMNYIALFTGIMILSVSPTLFATEDPSSLTVVENSQFQVESPWQETSSGGNFRIKEVELIDNMTLALDFSENLDTSADASRSFVIEDSKMGTELELTMSQIDDSDSKRVILLLGVALKENTQYKITVLEIRNENGNTIESGIDAFVNFTSPESFEKVSLNAAPEVKKEEVEETPVVVTPITTPSNPIEKTPVKTVSPKPNSTPAASNQVNITPLTWTGGTKAASNVGVNITDEELDTNKVTKAATSNETLPQTGPELWFLFACIAIFGWGIFLVSYQKKSS